MQSYDRSHLGDGALIQTLKAHLKHERGVMAEVLADLGEVLERRLYVPAGYPSMSKYCMGELGFSEDETYKRIQAAKAARDVPEILDAMSDGRLHLTAVVLLSPRLTRENAGELLRAASGKSKFQIQQLLAERFPQADVPEVVRPVPAARQPQQTSQPRELVPEPVANPTPVRPSAPRPVPPPKVTPLAPERFALQVTISGSTQQKLQRAKELLSHKLPSGNLADVLDLALDALIESQEKRKFAACEKPRAPKPGAKNPRHIPAHVKREVRKRDRDQCTFVSASGKRCESRTFLEFDHIEPVATGGRSTPGNLRLRCRAHNQYAAECSFGSGFMHMKRSRGGVPSHV